MDHPTEPAGTATRRPRRGPLLRFALVGALAALAGCNNWGPLTSSYNGQVRVTASGEASKTNTGGENDISLTDPDSDGNPVYAHTDWYLYGPQPNCQYLSAGCVSTYWQYSQSKTPEIQNTSANFTHILNYLDRNASALRIVSVACAQMGWPVPDSCSNDGVNTFDY